jgi:hypothetical protein
MRGSVGAVPPIEPNATRFARAGMRNLLKRFRNLAERH